MQPSLPWSRATACPTNSITHRAPFTLPGNARVAVWTIVNVENWQPGLAMPRGAAAAHGSAAAARHPQLVLARIRHARRLRRFPGCVERAPAQGHARSERHGLPAIRPGLPEPRSTPAGNSWATGMQQPCIAWPTRPRRSATPSPPSRPSPAARRGWESRPDETDDTIDLLAEAGIEYVADWVLDDQPVPIRTRSGDIVSVPYTVELNDVVISAVQLHGSDELLRRGRDQFDQLYRERPTFPRDGHLHPPLSHRRAAPDPLWRNSTTTSCRIPTC